MCVICDRLSMRVIPVAFNGIPEDEKKRIISAIEAAYADTGLSAYVIDEYHDNKRRCPAYPPDADGGQAIVHFGHCIGFFAGIEKCPYYNQSGGYASEACRYRKGARTE